MTDMTVGTLPVSASAAEPAKKSLFRRIFEALVEARTMQAEAMVREYRRTGMTPPW